MITIRRSQERGHANYDWLDTYHTFSFDTYYDPKHQSFRALRVINEDRVAAGAGFPTHPHRDMEIVTYVLEGSLEHKDSMGTGSTISPGELQRMSAGSGITHSEFNHSKTDAVHLLQIWIMPKARGLKPSYEQKAFPLDGGLKLVASPDSRDGALGINAEVAIHAGRLAVKQEVIQALAPGRHAWVQVAKGKLNINGTELAAGDGAAVSDETSLKITATEASELLLFDLA
jgi:redox-sensitive bicupin YhaK (pirin superfamily)